ncbi:GspE/PulE family protein [Geoalkalibacter subterraneus]|uniref:Bacterial type II secretion system protein E domain-containing protein n=1 Tax=Geoalkalibacter subterraneus TaxID=483547 RepID=A0A0B5FTV5_9BACT|nr:GspE/PulE family protein [Geoalkalibacter subterraneus]AJF08119.1 hypothetical protein GSUB_16545 [Geoalkalibacter subterraneus]
MSFLNTVRNKTANVVEKEKEEEKNFRLGDLLKEQGLLSDRDIQIIATEQKAIGGRFGEIALNLGLVNETQITQALAKQAGMQYFDLRSEDIDVDAAQFIDSEKSREHEILPLALNDNTLLVGITEPTNVKKRDLAKKFLGQHKLEFCAIDKSELFLVQSRVFPDLNFQTKALELAEQMGKDQNKDTSSLTPRLVNAIVWDALSNKASDIHLVYGGDIFRIFYRIAGALRYMYGFKPQLYSRVAAQIKQAAGMEPGDKLHAQGGNFNFQTGSRTVNTRVSKLPTVPLQEGESLVLRLLDQNRVSLNLKTLGFYPEDVEKLKKSCTMPYGMILCTGPTGSGKTTTLYSMLSAISAFDTKILTIEDPVEYQLPGICQVQVNARAEITFASALREFLRQDPDVILVGETRDPETAKISIQAALTGHLLFSTLHTNDAAGAIPRLLNYDVDINGLQSSLAVIIAQRLVRKLCKHCHEERPLTADEKELFLRHSVKAPETVRIASEKKSSTCKFCNGGYSSPTIIYETIYMDEDLREMIRKGISHREFQSAAIKKGMKTMIQCGLQKVADHTTSFSEVLKVTRVG